MSSVKVLRLKEMRISHLGIICVFDDNPYKVFIEIPGATVRNTRSKNPTRILFTGVFDSKPVRKLLHELPMYDRENTVFTSSYVKVFRSKNYIYRAKKLRLNTALRRNERVRLMTRFNRLPVEYIIKRPGFGGETPQPETWCF
jgi:hypothetical protein